MKTTDTLPLVPAAMEPARSSALAPANAEGVGALLTLAVEKGLSVEGLEKLVALQERILDRNAAAEFYDAMAQFQTSCPPIKKSSKASFNTKAGGQASYTYAELDEIARTVNPILARLGLSYTWDSTVTETGVMVCTCTLRHRSGHKVTAQFGSKIEGSSLMSGHQATAATLTYARRQSLVQVLGLTTTDEDIDGKDDRDDGDCIDPGQEAKLTELLTESGADKARFLRYYRAENLSKVLASDYDDAVKGLRAKIAQKGAPKS